MSNVEKKDMMRNSNKKETSNTKMQCMELQRKRERQALQNDRQVVNLKSYAKSESISPAKENLELKGHLEIERAQTKKLQIEITKMAETLKSQEGTAKQIKDRFQVFHNTQMNNWKAQISGVESALKAAQDELQAEKMKGEKMALQNAAEAKELKVRANWKLSKNNVELKRQLEIERAQTKKQHIELFKLAEALKNQQKPANEMKEKVALQNDVEAKELNVGAEMNLAKTDMELKLESQLEIERALTKKQQVELINLAETLKSQQESATQMKERFQVFHNTQMNNWKAQINSVEAALKAAQDELQAERMKGGKVALQNDAEAKELKVRAEVKLAKNNVELKRQLEIEKAQTKKQHIELFKLAEALKHQQEAANEMKERFQALHEDTMSKESAETDKMAGALTASQDLLKAEKMTTNQDEMQLFKDFSQAKLEEQRVAIIKLKAALEKSEQDLKAGQLQWQQEKFSLKEHCAHLSNSEGQHMGTQTLGTAQAVHQEMDEQRAVEILAALKASQDQLMTERLQLNTAAKKDKEILLNLCQARLAEQTQINERTKAALLKTEHCLRNARLEWQEERSSLTAKHAEVFDTYQSQLKVIAFLQRQETEAKQTLEGIQTAHQVQLEGIQSAHQGQIEEQKAETNKILLAMKVTNDLLETCRQENASLTAQLKSSQGNTLAELQSQVTVNKRLTAALRIAEQQLDSSTIEWDLEKSYLTASLDETAMDLENALLRNITVVESMEKEAAAMFERNQASQDQLISTIQKEREDSLEKQRLSFLEIISNLEKSKSHCVTELATQEEDHKILLATLMKKFEDDRESERLKWNQEKSDLLKITEQSLEREKEYQNNETSFRSQLNDLHCQITKKPKKKWYKFF
ncbi:uncharacterized protein ACO6RY_17048 [Pungitius sinensis]